LAILGVAVAAWMLRHPFVGIEHDGIIYAAMAGVSAGLLPLDSDLFFSHGAQFRYSIYPLLSGALVQLVGVTAASALIVGAAHTVFLTAAWFLVRPLAGAAGAGFSLLALAIAYPFYGNSAGTLPLLSFGEGFATARPLAEALGLLAITLATRRQCALSFVACGAAFAIHPLTALGAIAFVLLFAVRPRHLAGLTFLALTSLAIGLLTEPHWFFLRYDAAWWEVIEGAQALLLPSRTLLSHHAWNLFVLGVCALGMLSSQAAVRRIGFIAVLVAITGTFFAVIAEASRVAGFLALQTWRTGFLSAVVGALILPVLVHEVIATGGRRLYLILPLACGWLAMALTSKVAVAYAMIPVMLAVLAVIRSMRSPLQGELTRAWPVLNASRLGPPVVVASVSALLVLAALSWDARSAWSRFLSTQYAAASPVDGLVPKGATVFWVGAPITLQWFWLKRGSYVHLVAAANAGFSRELGVEFLRRNTQTTPLWSSSDPLCQQRVTIEGLEACLATPSNVAQICKNASGLDFVLAPSATSEGARFALSYPSPATGTVVAVNVYRCEDFRSNG
jgi:hypothetical protein